MGLKVRGRNVEFSALRLFGVGVSASREPSFPTKNTRFLFDIHSLPEFMDFILFGKTILVVNKEFGLFFWPINSGSESMFMDPGSNK